MIFEYLLDLLFPKKCVYCGASGVWFCDDCLGKIEYLDDVFVKERFRYLSNVIAVAKFRGPIKEAIHSFKYDGVKELAEILAEIVVQHLKHGYFDFVRHRVLVPVPLHRQKLIDRGFNQSELLAFELAKRLGLKLEKDILIKTKPTASQINLKKKERKTNIRGAFEVKNPSKIKNKKILLVDDVLTTGSTLDECAKVLKKAGAADVMGLVLAKD